MDVTNVTDAPIQRYVRDLLNGPGSPKVNAKIRAGGPTHLRIKEKAVRFHQQTAPDGIDNRRESTRFSLTASGSVTAPDGRNGAAGFIVDISETGFYLETRCPLPDSQFVEWTLVLSDSQMSGTGFIRTFHPGVGNGVEIIEMSARDRELLHDLLLELEYFEVSRQSKLSKSKGVMSSR
ncbi:MAG: PilZ domain-containing protein [Candidatus Korobacteraceae bacterium]